MSSGQFWGFLPSFVVGESGRTGLSFGPWVCSFSLEELGCGSGPFAILEGWREPGEERPANSLYLALTLITATRYMLLTS